MELKEINYGLAYTVCNGNKPLYIEINKDLNKYPKLKKQILAHEMLHWKSRGWFDDFKIDFFELFNRRKQREISKFCRKHKRAYLCNSPFFIENGKIIPNWFLVGMYSTIILISIILEAILI